MLQCWIWKTLEMAIFRWQKIWRLFRYALELHNNLIFKVFVDLKENCHRPLEAMTVATCKWVHKMYSYFSALVTVQNVAGYFGIYMSMKSPNRQPPWICPVSHVSARAHSSVKSCTCYCHTREVCSLNHKLQYQHTEGMTGFVVTTDNLLD